MDLTQLEYFRAVVEQGSFSKAAAVLGVSQPALSRHVKSLESSFGVALLYRHGRGVVPTEAGRTLMARCERIFDEVGRARQELANAGDVIRGDIVMGTPPTVGQILIRPLINRISRLEPGIRIRVVEGFSGHISEWLAHGRLDIAVIYTTLCGRTVPSEPIVEEELVLVGPAGAPRRLPSPLPLEKLQGLPLILPSRPHGLRLLIDRVARGAEIDLDIIYQVDALPTIKGLVEDGVGWTILPYSAIHEEVERKRLHTIRFVDTPLIRTLAISHAPSRPLTQAGLTVIDGIKAEIMRLHADGLWAHLTLLSPGRARPS